MNDLINMSFIYYNKALDYIDKNSISSAKEELEKAVKIYLKDIDILNLLGICEYYLCDFNMANYYWNKSIRIVREGNIASDYLDKLKTDEFSIFINKYNKGLDYFSNEKYVEAIEIFNGLLNYENKFIEIYEILIIAYLEMGDITNAQKYLELFSKFDVGNKRIEVYKKELGEKKVKINDKKNKIRKSSEKNNKIGTSVGFMIVVLLVCSNLIMYTNLQGEKREIIEVKQRLEKSKIEYLKLEKENNKLKKYISNNKDNGTTIEMQRKAEKYYFNKEYKKSIEEFKKILKNTSDNTTRADAIYFIAAAETKLNKIEEAKRYYEIYINNYENYSSYDEVLYNYIMILNNENQIEKAKQIAIKLKNEYPNSEYNNSKVNYILNK